MADRDRRRRSALLHPGWTPKTANATKELLLSMTRAVAEALRMAALKGDTTSSTAVVAAAGQAVAAAVGGDREGAAATLAAAAGEVFQRGNR